MGVKAFKEGEEALSCLKARVLGGDLTHEILKTIGLETAEAAIALSAVAEMAQQILGG